MWVLVLLVAAGGVFAATRGGLWSGWSWSGGAGGTGAANAPRSVPVEVATAIKKTVPVRIEAPARHADRERRIKSRIDTEIVGVHFSDGATVREGEVLFTLDSRAIEAQIKQQQGLLEGSKANLEQAERDVARYTEPRQERHHPGHPQQRTHAGQYLALLRFRQAHENLNIQLGYCTIRAPITGRASMATVKVGNFVRQADLIPLATIIQTAPVYVTFSVPQGYLPDLRQAVSNETATIEAVIPGDPRRATGQASS